MLFIVGIVIALIAVVIIPRMRVRPRHPFVQFALQRIQLWPSAFHDHMRQQCCSTMIRAVTTCRCTAIR